MIYTCTLNPSVDYVMTISDVEMGALNRTNNTAFYPGGKGINVSRVLKKLGQQSIALGFIGGFSGDFIQKKLDDEGVTHNFHQVSMPSRINIKLKSSVETEINAEGPVITRDDEANLLKKLSSLTTDDYFVLAGSLPSTVSEMFYEQISKECLRKGTRLVVDTSGKALEGLLDYKPFLIKPNQQELAELFQVTITTVEESINYGKKLLEKGPENIIVSLGKDGAVFINQEITAYANVPKGVLKNSVGAGDSVVAGFLSSYVQSDDFIEAFKYGIAAGSATAFSNDLCDKETLESLLDQIEIEIIK